LFHLLAFDSHGIRKDNGVWNYDLPPLFGGHDRCAGLDIGNVSFDSCDADEIAESERFLQQQENACEEVLKNILKRKTDRNGADTQYFDQIRGLKGRSNDGDCDQETHKRDACVHEPCQEERYASMSEPP